MPRLPFLCPTPFIIAKSTLISLFDDTDTMNPPSGWMAMSLTAFEWALQCWVIFYVRKSCIVMFFYLVAVTTVCQFGWKRVLEIGLQKHSYLCRHFFFYTSHIMSFLSSPPEAIKDMSSEISELFTQFVCPIQELLNFNVLRSQSLILLSSLEESNDLPSEVKFTDLTAAVCPFIVLVFVSVPGYHSFIRLSWDPLARMFYVGQNANELHCFVCPSSRRFLFEFATFHNEMLFQLPHEAKYFLTLHINLQVIAKCD